MRTFGTTGAELLALRDWLEAHGVTHVAMESTGVAPFAESLTHLDTVPGIARRTAEVIVAEIEVDMRRFPSDRHLASWAGLCPGNNESAGKHTHRVTRHAIELLERQGYRVLEPVA